MLIIPPPPFQVPYFSHKWFKVGKSSIGCLVKIWPELKYLTLCLFGPKSDQFYLFWAKKLDHFDHIIHSVIKVAKSPTFCSRLTHLLWPPARLCIGNCLTHGQLSHELLPISKLPTIYCERELQEIFTYGHLKHFSNDDMQIFLWQSNLSGLPKLLLIWKWTSTTPNTIVFFSKRPYFLPKFGT